MLNTGYVSLEINTSSIRFVLAAGNKIIKYGTTMFKDGIIRDGVITDQKALGAVIDSMFKSFKLPKNHVLCNITGLQFLNRNISLPSSLTNKSVVNEALIRAAKKEMHLSQEDFVFHWQVVERLQDENSYFVIAVRKEAIQALVAAMLIAKIKLDVIDLKPLAIARVFSGENAVLACLDKDYCDILFVADGMVRTVHGFSPGKFQTTLDFVNEFVDGLNKALRSHRSSYTQNQTIEGPLLLCGELSSNSEIVEMIRQATTYKVDALSPVFKHKPKNPFGDSVSLYVNSIGSLLIKQKELTLNVKESGYHDIVLNILITGEIRDFHAWIPYAITAAACFVMVALSSYVYFAKVQEQSFVKDLERESLLLTGQFNNQKQIYDGAMAIEEKVKALNMSTENIQNEYQQMVDQKCDYARYLQEIQGALPEGVIIGGITINNEFIVVNGSAVSSFHVLGFSKALEQSSIYSEATIVNIQPEADASDFVSFSLNIKYEFIQ